MFGEGGRHLALMRHPTLALLLVALLGGDLSMALDISSPAFVPGTAIPRMPKMTSAHRVLASLPPAELIGTYGKKGR